MGSGSKIRVRYSVHPSVAHGQRILDNLTARTGRSLEDWAVLLRREGPEGEPQWRDWLKWEHGLGGTIARLIVQRAIGQGAEDTDPKAYLEAAAGWVEAMYAGRRAALRPIHDALVSLGLSLGEDVKVCPCETIVPLYRNHVFAEIKPAALTRVDLGLALRGAGRPVPGGLIATGGLGKGDRITHRFPLTSVDEIDDEVREWLRLAYELDS